MQELQTKLKRQIEILGVILSQNYRSLKTFDLAEMFGVEELTIKRDLKELRSAGIDIHSEKRRGVSVSRKIDDITLKEFIGYYHALCYAGSLPVRATSLLLRKLDEKGLANIITLQLCIEHNRVALIDYEKESGGIDFRRRISPMFIFESMNYWRVLAKSDGIIKQFHLNKIVEVRQADETFKPLSRLEIDDIFRYSWRSWLGTEKIAVKLELDRNLADEFRLKQLMDYEKFEEAGGGKYIYSTIVNSLEEISRWVASQGKGMRVLEPDDLKERVIEIAKQTLGNYD
jgi:predicted DNA-binding transcriptional regulator YafY